MPKKMPSQFSSVRTILPKPLQHLGIVEQVKLKRIWRAWLDVIGTHITQHARPTRLYHRTLVIRVKGKAWHQELNFHKNRFMLKLNDYFGHPTIDEIQLELGDLPPMPRITTARRATPSWMEQEIPEEWENEIEKNLSHIPEGDIKNTARRIMANHFKLHRLSNEKL